MKTDEPPEPGSQPQNPEPVIPGGSAATPDTPEGRQAAIEEGEEA
jgi:hypothetical protein